MRRLLLGAGLLLASLVAWADVPPIPALTARVTDLTATLSGDQRQHLEQQLAALEAKSGAQLAVLLVPTTGDDSIEEYAVRTFEKWKLGQKKVDDGVLLLVAKNDRTLRIEVGYGLEGPSPTSRPGGSSASRSRRSSARATSMAASRPAWTAWCN